MLTKQLAVAGVALGACTVATAQEFFDFGQLPGAPEPAVQVDLNPTMINLFSPALRAENPAAADLLAGIRGVRVRIYHGLDDIDAITGFVGDVATRLEQGDWERLVSIKDDASVDVYIRGVEETITGLTVMVVDARQAVFVNVAGTITAEQLAQAMASLDLDGMMDAGQMLGAIGAVGAMGAAPTR